MSMFFKNIGKTSVMYKVDVEIRHLKVANHEDLAAEMLSIEWKRGPQVDNSQKVFNAPSDDGLIQLGAKFERICHLRFNSKQQIQQKICEFRLIGTSKGKSRTISSKKFDFASRINSKNSIYIDIGKGVELSVLFNFQVAD
jgi:hypothetical protein